MAINTTGRSLRTSGRGRWRAAGLAALALLTTVALAQPADAATQTFVSLTFDDGQASHAAASSALAAHGLQGTFYINSALVGSSSYYMTWPQVHAIADSGSEIGGHTLHHQNLTAVDSATATREVCDDRTALQAQGFSPLTSFAYPEASSNSSVEQIVASCGYSNARTVGNINSVTVCTSCPYAETIPPRDPYYLRTPEAADSTTTLSRLESYVTNAETHGGGWVILTFHGICDNSCTGSNSFSATLFGQFLDWLAPRAGNADPTVVRTIGSVMGAPTPPPPSSGSGPTSSAVCNDGSCQGWFTTTPVTLKLQASGSGSISTVYTTDGSDPRSSGSAQSYTQPLLLSQTTTVRFASTDSNGTETPKTQTVSIDAVGPTVAITAPANGTQVKRTTTVTVTASAADAGTGAGAPSGLKAVTFYDGTSAIGTDTTAPYAVSWSPPKSNLGTHALTAVAVDVAGNQTRSATVSVTVVK